MLPKTIRIRQCDRASVFRLDQDAAVSRSDELPPTGISPNSASQSPALDQRFQLPEVLSPVLKERVTIRVPDAMTAKVGSVARD